VTTALKQAGHTITSVIGDRLKMLAADEPDDLQAQQGAAVKVGVRRSARSATKAGTSPRSRPAARTWVGRAFQRRQRSWTAGTRLACRARRQRPQRLATSDLERDRRRSARGGALVLNAVPYAETTRVAQDAAQRRVVADRGHPPRGAEVEP
jgi:hypothetical protein